MKLYVFEVEAWEESVLAELEREHDVQFVDEPLKSDNASTYRTAEAVSTFIYSRIDEAVLEALPNLRLITTRSTGTDHIDTEACASRGVTVCNVPSYGKHTVAEHVFALLLAISHRIIEAVDRTRKGDFTTRGLEGFDLMGRTLGVVGTGDIGMEVIRIARGFGMNVLAFDIHPKQSAADELDFQYVALENLLREADIVTLHVPATPKTRHLIAEEQFAAMQEGTVLINTARGDVVDISALARALAEGKVAAAGLDVLPEEPVVREEAEVLRSIYERNHDLATLLADQVLVRMRNVVVTPHTAFNTREAVRRILDTTIDNVRAFDQHHATNVVSGR